MSVLEDVLDMIGNKDEALDAKNVLLALNKFDLVDSNQHSSLPLEVTAKLGGAYPISCETNHGIDSFLDALTSTVLARVASSVDENAGSEGAIITRARHRQHVEAAVEALLRFEELSQQGPMAVDMAAEELRLATSELGRITGAVDVEEVLDVLFTDFCIGK
jgi:tRNA modification GTPase